MSMEYLSGVKKEKLANTIVFFAEKLQGISKTKLLKLLYILEEYYIRKYKIPFLDIDFEVWQAGPVNKEVFSELSDTPIILKDYIENVQDGRFSTIKPLKTFSDDEFSDNELEMLQFIVDNFGGHTASQLVDITHRPISPWYIIAREKGLLESFQKGLRNTSEEKIDFERFFCDSETSLNKYKEQKMFNSFVQHFSK
jgi:uncharacterized phage-associated protein